MTFELKTLSPEAVPRALEKAERYRLLNEPGEAESICLDALDVEPDNQEALVTLLLALTDQFDTDAASASPTPAQSIERMQRRLRARLLHRHRLRAARQGAAPHSTPGIRSARLRVAARSDELVREGRSASGRPATTMRCCAGTRAPG